MGNLDVQGKLPHEKYYLLFEPLPNFMQIIAFLDRNVRLSGVFEKRRYPQGMFDFGGMPLIL